MSITNPPANLIQNRSPLAELVDKPRDVRNQPLPAIVIVDHITGRSTWNNAEKARQDPQERIEDYFTKDGRPFAHFSIEPWGSIIQIAYERERPWAQGLDMQLAKEAPPAFWHEYWTKQLGYNTVAQLLAEIHWAHGWIATANSAPSPNHRAIAIEHIQYGNQFKLTGMQYRMSHLLHMDIAIRHGMDLVRMMDWKHRFQVLGHEDVNPWARGTSAGGWDPGALRISPRFCWRCLLTLDFTHGGTIKRCPAVLPTPKMPGWLKEIRKVL